MLTLKSRPQIPPGPYLVVGLARSGAAAALALRACGERVIGVDAGTPAGTEVLRRAGVELHLDEGAGAGLLEQVRAVVKSPGVPAGARLMLVARERGLAVLGELELAWRMLTNEFVAVTGTNGKTTTVELIGHIHREAGSPVAVAGNVGTAVSSLAGDLGPDATVVCEASSFQLEDTLEFAPEAAVLLNITPDHLDRHGTFEAYTAAKFEVFARQQAQDVAVAPSELLQRLALADAAPRPSVGVGRMFDFGRTPAAAVAERDGLLWWQGERLLAVEEMRLRGRHNAENAMAAAAVCLARGLDRNAVRAGLRSFPGVAHRLEEVATLGGVLFVNDSKATNVASTLVALEAFAGRELHLMLGGQAKGQDFAGLRGAIEQRCAGVYLIGEDAEAIANALRGAAVPVSDYGELAGALQAARSAAHAGAVVLLSPACASFDQFSDFEARGERFRELVEEMKA